MFSKIYNSDLHFANSELSLKYKKIGTFLSTDDQFSTAHSLNTKRQHNFLSSKTFITKNLTNFDVNSLKKLINYNFKNNLISSKNRNFYINNFNYNNNNSLGNFDNHTYYSFLNKNKFSNFFIKKNKNYSYIDFIKKINNDSDKKQLPNPHTPLFNKKNKKILAVDMDSVNNIKLNLESIPFLNLNENDSEFTNKSLDLKKFELASSNQSVLLSNRNVRQFVSIKPNTPSLNHSFDINHLNLFLNSNFIFSHKSSSNLIKNLFVKNIADNSFVKLSQSKILVDAPLSPIPSSNLLISSKGYDNLKFVYADNTPVVLQGKEEVTPTTLTSIY